MMAYSVDSLVILPSTSFGTPRDDHVAQARRRAFEAQVRRLRGDQGMCHEQLAHAAGLDRTYVGSVERGERTIALDNIWLLADTLEVGPERLLAEPDPRPARIRSAHPTDL